MRTRCSVANRSKSSESRDPGRVMRRYYQMVVTQRRKGARTSCRGPKVECSGAHARCSSSPVRQQGVRRCWCRVRSVTILASLYAARADHRPTRTAPAKGRISRAAEAASVGGYIAVPVNGAASSSRLPDEAIQMVMARQHASNSVLRRCAYIRRRVVCVERELPLHVIEEQPVVQTLALEQFRICAPQPSRDRSESDLVEASLGGQVGTRAPSRTIAGSCRVRHPPAGPTTPRSRQGP